MSTHRTAAGKYLDINALKIQQERTIAVGNARQNARGDILGAGGEIIKTRDQIMAEYYKSQQGSNLTDNPVYASSEQANQALVADIFAEPISNGFDQIAEANVDPTVVSSQSGAPTNGGLSDAAQRSAELAEKLRAQRNRI